MHNRLLISIAAFGLIALLTAIGSLIALHPTPVGFLSLTVVLLISVWGGLLIGTVSSAVATLCYNFFFFPPLYTFTIAEPANWFALVAFLIASVTVNRLVVAARVQAGEGGQRGQERERRSRVSVHLFTAPTPAAGPGPAAGRAGQTPP